jgi:hypothetical protein
MGIFIGKYEFDGPYYNVNDLEEKEGLYAVLHCDGNDYELIHLAHADNVRERIELVPTPENPKGNVLLAAFYTPRCGIRERNIMVEDIQKEFDD